MRSGKLFLFAGVAAGALFLATFAQAQVVPSGADIVARVQSALSRLPVGADTVAQNDAAAYVRLDIAARFGVRFQPHVAVCDTSVAGDVHCDSRVVLDDFSADAAAPDAAAPAAGTPDRSRSDRGGGGGGGSAPPPLPKGYGPAQFLKAYGLTGVASGHPIIAIVDAYDDPNIVNDLATYNTTFGIPSLPTCSGPIAQSSAACFQKVNQSGSTTSHPQTNAGWALEISLDVEVAHAVCQDCKILLVEANSNSYANLMAAEDRAALLGATVVSNSWGSSEFSGEASYDSHFNHPGVAFTVSAGDAGYGAEYPASSPFVTAVGGTSLFLNGDGSYNTELVWSGTGSGCSAFEPKPLWQLDVGCGKRTVADVSADADPNTGAAVYDTVRYAGRSGWFQVGGTSLSSPIIAAVYALSSNTSGNANNIPYALGNASNLHDVTSGSNWTTLTGDCGTYLCMAQLGYDGPTGLGTPNGAGAF